jgi:5-(carboxyamino)imidazole ribonucleotide synthase
MMSEAASALALPIVVLADAPTDAAALVTRDVVLGSARSADDLAGLAARCDVMTFDHEQVDLDALGQLEHLGHRIRPGTQTLHMAVDKAVMRSTLEAAGIPVPAFALLAASERGEHLSAIASFADSHRWPIVVKSARGGYDGKGVWIVPSLEEAAPVLEKIEGDIVLEEYVSIDAELATLVVRRPGGQIASWPTVETAQIDGVCREVLVPGTLDPSVAEEAAELGRRVAELAQAVGVFAVELFWSNGTLLVNEVAARPHNSGHWTIDGSETSQFENHLRAVLDLPLGGTERTAAHVASVNVFGGPSATDPAEHLGEALSVKGARIHLYGKGARPGRKLGHVTVCGDTAGEVRARAWEAAEALGAVRPTQIELVEP